MITVAIPALNEAKNIARCIESIRTHAPRTLQIEIYVGDHGSTDGTSEIAVARGARALHLPGGTVGNLRNRIVSASQGSVLIFLDADTTVTAEWGVHLPAVAAEVASSPLQVTGSLCTVPDSDSPFIRFWFAKIRRKDSGYLGTGHLIVSRALFEKIGGFDPTLRSGEDYDFCVRARQAGAELIVRPELRVVHHEYPLTAGAFVRREIWHGTGDFQSLRRLVNSKVALSALLFSGLQLLSLAMLPVGVGYFLALQALSALAVAAQSWMKFPGLGMRERIANIAIFHLYLFGRGLALGPALRSRRAPRVAT